jgi:hypothetical protein
MRLHAYASTDSYFEVVIDEDYAKRRRCSRTRSPYVLVSGVFDSNAAGRAHREPAASY